jgi:hypothetical protein
MTIGDHGAIFNASSAAASRLLDLASTAGLFDFRLQLLGIVFGNTGLQRLGHAFDQVLGFLQTKSRRSTNNLDDVDLGIAKSGQNDVEFSLDFAGSMPWTSFK